MDSSSLASRPLATSGLALKTGIVVIGASQAGLSAAYHLKRRGLTPHRGFVVLDQSPQPGGAWQYRRLSLTLRAEIDRFQGRQLHTKDYRGAVEFAGKHVPDRGRRYLGDTDRFTLCDPSLLDYE